MPYLPNRFLLWFTYAAIVLLKALYSGAMLRADHADVHKLIDRLCEAFAETSRDADHPAVRYGQQLQALRVKLGGIATSANSPTGGGTVPLPPTDDASVPEHKPEAANERGERNGERNGGDPEVWFPPGPQAGAAGAPLAPFPYATPGYSYGFVAPPHEQPLSEISSLQIGVDQNLGFATLDDWFPGGVAPPQGPGIAAQQAGSVPGVTPIIPGAGPAGNPFEALDLADFWMKVGPGEAQGGFPFR
jgi:hypothetical protein